jgi:PadR family transcriptional regulator PadR
MVDKELLKGSTPMLILAVISEKPSYGYEIAKRIEERSEGILEGKEGTLYPLLHQLEAKKWLKSFKEEVAGRTRKYYRITQKGKAQLAKMLGEWKSFSEAVDKTVATAKKLGIEFATGWSF